MNKLFSTRMLELRSERGISQKEAAAQLNISQALLSHYEKGIRECGLEFLCKAAAFYDVSCDYLLGIIDTRRSFGEEFENIDLEFDNELRTSTLFRAATMLHDNIAASGNGKGDAIKHYFSLAMYSIAIMATNSGNLPKSWLNLPGDIAYELCQAKMKQMINSLSAEPSSRKLRSMEEPLCVKTVITDAEKIISKEAERIVSSSHT